MKKRGSKSLRGFLFSSSSPVRAIVEDVPIGIRRATPGGAPEERKREGELGGVARFRLYDIFIEG